jgi:hypothetical protein
MKKRLEIITNVVQIGVASLVAVMLLTRPQQVGAPEYAKGEKLPVLSGTDFSKHDRNLVFVVRSTCQYCTASMDFYRSVVQTRNQSKSDVAVIAVAPEALDTSRAYLDSYQLKPDEIVSIGPGDLQFPGTPYIILADSTGSVLETWRGQLSKDREVEFMKTVFVPKS